MNGFVFFKNGDVERLFSHGDEALQEARMKCLKLPCLDTEYPIRNTHYFRTFNDTYVYYEFTDQHLKSSLSSLVYPFPNYCFCRHSYEANKWIAVDIDRIEIYDLKKCPFCGEEVTIRCHSSDRPKRYSIHCSNSTCICETGAIQNASELVNNWNTRFKEEESK